VAARLIALYQQPEDPAAFDAHYLGAHTPIILRYPGLRELRTTKVEPIGPRSTPYYIQAEMVFETRADLDAAIGSEAGIESARDLRNFATAGVTLFVMEDDATTTAAPIAAS
jgi:uncharacterized protein (TIGR02118 family)